MDIFRTFKVDSRSIVSNDRKYAGVVSDSLSTSIHFTYDPIDFLASDSDDYWIPWIIFNVHYTKEDKERYPYADIEVGRPMQYSLNSTPPFNGVDFDIPWDITRRVKTNRLEYQLLFVKASVKYDGRGIAKLDSTKYLLSPLDSIALKPSVKCLAKSECCGTPPYTEPSMQGLIEIFKEHAVLTPIGTQYNEETKKTEFVFHTYNGREDCTVSMDFVPLNKFNKIDPIYLDIIKEWGEESDENMASAKLILDSLNKKTDVLMAIPEWNAETAFGNRSVVFNGENLYMSRADENVGHETSDMDWWGCLTAFEENTINDWEQARTDNIPSSVLVKESLDAKLDDTQIVNDWDDVSETEAPSTKIVREGLDTKVDRDQIVNAWSMEPSEVNIPSESLLKATFEKKTNMDMAIPIWEEDVYYKENSTVVDEGQIYISTIDNNFGNRPITSPDFWTEVRGGGSAGGNDRVFSKLIGDGVSKTIEVVHGLGTEDVFVNLRLDTGERDYLYADISVKDKNTVVVDFLEPIDEDSVAIVIAKGASVSVVNEIPPGTSKTEFLIPHNYGTYNLFVQVRRVSDGRLVDAHISTPDPSNVKITFSSPPVEEYSVIVSPYAGDRVYGAKTFSFSRNDPKYKDEPPKVWTIIHNLGRIVQVQAYDEDGDEMEGLVKWTENDSLNSVTITFNEGVYGTAVVR